MQRNQLFDRKFAAMLLLILGALLAISPAGLRKSATFSPEEVIAAITSKTDFVTAEDLSAWIIDKRPDILVVDLRSPQEYNQYHIPGAINIPLARLFDEHSLEMLNDVDYTIVLYSNGSTNAAQAWVLLRQRGVESYVLMGGLNYWAKAILNPQPPGDLVADSEILQYQFRKAAAAYFNGGKGVVTQQAQTKPLSHPRPKIKLKKKQSAEEGC